MAAIHEPTRIVVIEVPGCAPFAEVGIDPEAEESEIAWVGAPPRMLVLSRYAAHSTVHLLDPYGPRTIAEIRLEAPMKLVAAVGAHALVIGGTGAAVLTATETHLTPYQFPARAVPVCAGAAGAQFVVALAGSVEEWDPQSRMPKRRLKLPKPATITAVGGSDRVLWMTSVQDPSVIEVIPLVNRGQPKIHELPEPIARVTGHPRSDLLICVGATTGRVFVVDLDGRRGPRVIAPAGIDRADAAGLVLGRMTGVLIAQAARPVAIMQLDGPAESTPSPIAARESEIAIPSTLFGPSDAGVGEVPTSVTLSSPPLPPIAVVPPQARPTEELASWRARITSSPARTEPTRPRAETENEPSWRDELAVWARAIAAGGTVTPPPAVPAIENLIARFELAPELFVVIALLYGTHLTGSSGAAPHDIARVDGHRWDDALGRGQLAERGVAVYRDSRVRLAPPVQASLDELAPQMGTLIGEAGLVALLGPCVIVARDGELRPIAEACLASVGCAILTAHAAADPHDVFLEARARGAVPMVRVVPGVLARIRVDMPAILIATDDKTADDLGLPRLT
ncbi:MAG: hypothetical protein JWO36_5285 [Myxococcales bacterium]|nr:hypothetical protein [Myxococcales bacterium]